MAPISSRRLPIAGLALDGKRLRTRFCSRDAGRNATRADADDQNLGVNSLGDVGLSDNGVFAEPRRSGILGRARIHGNFAFGDLVALATAGKHACGCHTEGGDAGHP